MKRLAWGVRVAATAVVFGVLSAPLVSADPAPSAAPPGSASPPPRSPKVLSGADIPLEPSAVPAAKEWSSATPVLPGRGSPRTCSFSLLREWLRVHCTDYAGAGLVAGDPKGVSVSVNGQESPVTSTVVLPLRRGESKIVSFVTQDFDKYSGVTLREAGTLSVVWRSGRRDPVLVLR